VPADIGAGRSTQGERERLRSRRCPGSSDGSAGMAEEASLITKDREAEIVQGEGQGNTCFRAKERQFKQFRG